MYTKLIDFLGKVVRPGDSVVLLKKVYGYRSLSSARLVNAIYKGPTQWGHTFTINKNHDVRYREPECIRIKGGKVR